MSMFLNATIPGFEEVEYLATLVPLLTSSNPNAIIKNMALDHINLLCNNSTSTPDNTCDPGFILDPLNGTCFISLKIAQNYWQAIEACANLESELVGFDNDIQVQTILKLLNEGIISSWY
jgi:hypothetical protein